MQVLRHFSRITSLTTRPFYSKGDDIIPLVPGSYHFYGFRGWVALRNDQLVSTVRSKKATINVVKTIAPATFLFQESSTQKWIKFTDTGNVLVSTVPQASPILAGGYKNAITTPPSGVTVYVLFALIKQYKKPMQIVPSGLDKPLHLVDINLDPQEAIKGAFTVEKV